MAEKVIIPLGGMTNVPDVNVSKDGDMQLLVNMRHVGGDVQHIVRPRETEIEGLKAVYRHAAADRLLGVSEDGKVYDITNANWVELGLGETKVPLSQRDVRSKAGENNIPVTGGNPVRFDVYGFGGCTLYAGNGLLKVAPDAGVPLAFSHAGEQPWRSYRSSVKYVRVEGYTEIGAYAFAECAVEGVVIPDGVTTIGDYAFANSSLKTIFIPASVETISDTAFSGCNISDVYIMSSVDNIEALFPNKPTLHVNHGVSVDYTGVVDDMHTLAYHEVQALSFVGNIVEVRCKERVVNALWGNGKYKNLGEFPRELGLKIGMDVQFHETLVKSMYYTAAQAYNNDIADKDGNIWNYVAAGYFDQLLDFVYQKKLYVDNALFVVAARLFDGSYVQLSPLIFVRDPGKRHEFARQIGPTTNNPLNYLYNSSATSYIRYPYAMEGQEDNFKAFASFPGGSFDKGYYAPIIRAMELSYKLSEYDWSEWDDFISSVEIFTTGSIMRHKKQKGANRDEVVREGINNFVAASPKEVYVVKEEQEFYEEIANSMMFYRVAKYDLKGNIIDEVDNTSPSNLAVQQKLEKLVSPHSMTHQEVLSLYNSREHQARVTKKYYDGYALPINSGENVGALHVVTEVERPKGNIVVMRTIEDFAFPQAGIGPLFTYPDISVKRMTLYFSELNKKIVCDMKPGSFFSYYLHSIIKETEVVQANVEECKQGDMMIEGVSVLADVLVREMRSIGFNVYDGEVFALSVDENGGVTVDNRLTTDKSLVALGVEIDDKNYDAKKALELSVKVELYNKQERVVQDIKQGDLEEWDGVLPEVSGVEKVTDVLYVSELDNPFYFPNTYKFDGDIIAIASSTEEVSSGQFGQYPMYVFTTEGIWALGVDTSGQGAYVTQTPVSREVCTGQTCPVTGGVVFATARGIMLISGAKVVNLSAALDGTNDGQSEIITKIAALAGIDVSLIKFRTYIQGCVIAYNYLYNEIIVSNTKYKYSYVYSLDNAMWSIVDRVYESRVNSYPDLMMYDKDKIYSFIERTTSAPILCMTRPIKVSTTNHKRVKEAALRGTWEGKMYFYVLGSNDGETWRLIGGREYKETGKHRDLVASIGRSRSYRYVAIAIASPNFKGRLSMVELLVTDGIGDNGLR